MSDTAKQNYELAFHISSNMDEAGVQKTRENIEKIVTSHGGVISFAKDPEKIRLAYPIKHQLSAFFGYFNFGLEEGEAVHRIRDEIRLNNDVLRFLILKQIEESKTRKEDVIRRIAASERRKAKAKQAEKLASQKQEGPKMDEKVIDKKLEEIIDKL